MLRTTVRGLLAHKRRVAGTSLAVILGVAFLMATLVMGATLTSGFGATYRSLNAGIDVVIRNPTVIGSDNDETRGTLDASVAERTRALPGVASAVGTVAGIAQIVGADGQAIGGTGPPTEGAAWIRDPALNPRQLTEGRAPRRTGEVVIDARSARDGKLPLGAETTIRTPTPVPVTVVGIVRLDAVDRVGFTYVGFTLRQATQLFVASGQVSNVIVHGDGSGTDAALRDDLSRALGSRIEVLTGSQLLTEQRAAIDGDVVAFVRGLLTTFAVIALVVAAFSIQNTFSIVMAQRTRESALLRAIGATRRQVLVAVLGEAAITGALASAAGVGVGVALGAGLRTLFAGFGLDVPGSLVVRGSNLVLAGAVGVGITLMASLWPAVRSSRVAPVAALRDLATETDPASRVRFIVGAILALAGAALAGLGGTGGGSTAQVGLGALAVVAAAVCLGPVVARPAAGALGAPLAALRGPPGRLARGNAMRNPRRTASSALALMIGTAVVALLATFGASVRASGDQAVRRSFGGDLVISQDDFGGAGVSDAVAPAVARLPEVERALPLGDAVARVGRQTVYPTVVDLAKLDGLLDVDVSKGDLARLRPGQVAVSEHYRAEHRLGVGSLVLMRFADGGQTALRVGLVYEQRALVGDLILSPADWAPHARRAGVVAVAVELADGVGLQRGRAAVERVTRPLGSPPVQDRDQYIESQAGPIDQLLALAYGLLGVAVVIALLGIANTLSLSIHERTRELGLLRAVGLSRSWLRATIRWEAVITAMIGTVTGLTVGTFLGWSVIRVLAAKEGFVTFQAPTVTLAVVLVAAGFSGVIASVRPARRAGRMDVLAAIAEA